ncbi:Glutathione S-transferase TCHQD [Platanthera zijinensis]|uniref:Glutathione S-transferase TCHQD n=1 Tax=Platanthera zijinensis TaxID=2320716 RepID=A0AAP0GAN2_9ASPA
MQLYHHPYSLDSQKIRLVLEEKGIDYTSYRMNPLTGKNMDTSFFRMNPSAKLPVLQNGSQIIYRVIDMAQKFMFRYIERVAVSLNGGDSTISEEIMLWMQQIEEWNPKFFTLSHVPNKYRLFISKFVRRVVIARMAEAPDIASVYHVKLREAYETEDKLKDPDIVKQSVEKLTALLDEAETRLKETKYLAGDEFTLADSMFIPLLVRLTLLNLEKEFIFVRPRLAEYHNIVKQRSSYKVVIGRYFSGWRKYKTLMKTICFLCIRNMFRKY